jgi:hypothetical protein
VLGLRQCYRASFGGNDITVTFGIGWAGWWVVVDDGLASRQGYRVNPNGFRHRIIVLGCGVDGVLGLRQGYRARFDGTAITVLVWHWMDIRSKAIV